MASVSSQQSSPPRGHPMDIFDAGFDHKFVCGFCKLILKDPLQSFCGHRFCQDCVTYFLRQSPTGEVNCQCCEEEGVEDRQFSVLKMDQMFPDNAVKREMAKMATKCVNPGCHWKGSFKDFKSHESTCPGRLVPCSACGESVPLSKQAEHLSKECRQRKTTCKFCSADIIQAESEVHFKTCLKYPTKCDNCGKKKIPRDQLEEHVERECQKRMIQCPVGCPEQMNMDKFVSHITKNQGTHLAWVMERMFYLERQITMGINGASSQGDLNGIMAGITELQQKVQGMEGQLQVALSRNTRMDATEAKVSSFEPIMGVLHREIEKCLQAIEGLERKQVAERQRTDQLAQQVEQYEQKLRSLERAVALKDIALAEHDLRMQCLELASYDGTLLWRISDVSKKRQEAATGKVTSLYSPAFFTGRIGYKMCARIYLNGDGMGKGSHISLFFVLMRGHYDSLLPWPFQQKVTLMMIDQNFKEHIVDTFRPDSSSSSFRRPTSEMNIASGCPLFLPLARLNDSHLGYIKDDVMFVKVIVDTDGLDKYTDLNPLKVPIVAPPQK